MIPFFIHIPKNGGMTVRRSPLIQIQPATANTHISKKYTEGLLSHMKKIGDHHGIEHARWRDINPGLWFNYRPFAIVRNPWDRVVSRYFFAKKVIEIEKKEPVGKHKIDSFEHFLEERFEWGNVPYMWHRAIRGWYPAFDHVCDPLTGEIASNVDILRFEKYDQDFMDYFRVFERPRPRNVTALNKGSYRDVYTDKTIQIVADWYKKDIETWGYDFDTGPTRNTWSQR